MVRINYKRAHLVFERLDEAFRELGRDDEMEELLNEVIENHQYDWRSRTFLALIYAKRGDFEKSLELFKEAARFNPHNLSIHQKIWKLFVKGKLSADKIEDYIKLTEEIIFFLDPFVCIECGYKTTEFLWKCPHCHGWDSFTEARM